MVTDQQVLLYYDFHHFIINNFSTSDITLKHYQTILITIRKPLHIITRTDGPKGENSSLAALVTRVGGKCFDWCWF